MFMTAFGRISQNNAVLLEYNDSRDYEHQTNMTFRIPVGQTVTVPLTNLNSGEVLVAIKGNRALEVHLVDGANFDATLQINRWFQAPMKGLTGLTIKNLDTVLEADVTVIVADE